MRATHSLSFIYPVLALWLAVMVHAGAQAARVAVIGDPSLSDMVDLTTAELSKDPDLNMVERADMDKLGHEQALKEMVSSNDLSSIQFVPADGLVILRAVKQDGKIGVFARLVAVQPGIVLREAALPDGADPVAQAQAIATEFAPYWPKLTAIQKGKITALSLLGLRFEVDAPETQEMERRINVLLASRLSTEPDTVVLERWRLNDAVFEKSLNAAQPAPFWTGSSLIDGSMKFADNQVTVTLRVRPPQGTEISITDTDKADNLPALVGRLADKIQTHPMTASAWQPAAEADHFAALGKWCLDNHLYDEGAEAIESALALGNTSRTTQMLQIRAYALITYPVDSWNTAPIHGADSGYGHASIDPDSIPNRLQAGKRTADLACQYLAANASALDAQGTLEDPRKLDGGALYNCLRLLRLAHEQGIAADDTTDLRRKVQQLIAQLNLSFATESAEERNSFLKYEIQYAAFWHETPEATLAYYSDLLGSKTDGAVNRQDLFEPGYPILHSPYLDADADLPAPPWYIGSPWLISWDNRPAAEIKTLFQNFIGELASSTDPVVQSDALKFKFASTQARNKRDELGAQFIVLLQLNHDLITGPRGNDFVAGFYPAIEWAYRNPVTTARNYLRGMAVEELQAHAILPAEWIHHMPMLYFSMYPADQAKDLPSAFMDYYQWYQKYSPQDPKVVSALDQAQHFFVDLAADATKSSPMGGYLPVHRHWPDAAGIMQSGMQGGAPLINGGTFMTAENKVWVVSPWTPWSPGQVVCIDPASQQIVGSYPIPDEYTQGQAGYSWHESLDVGPQFLAAALNGRVLVCSRADKIWRALDVPPANYKPRWISQELYLLYEYHPVYGDTMGDSGAATAVSGLMHVKLPGGEIENLVSSRRIPPLTPLDGKPIGYAMDVWGSSDGLMFALRPESPAFQIFSAALGKNDWKLVTSDSQNCQLRLTPDGALIGRGFAGHGFSQLSLMKGNTSDLLLSNPGLSPVTSIAPEWDCPEDMKSSDSTAISQLSAVMRGNDLCVYRNLNTGAGDGKHAWLFYFAQGQKSAVKIPLEFGLEGITDSISQMQNMVSGYQSIYVTDADLIIDQLQGGFWVIPWSDIDAYRAKVAPGTVSSTPVSIPGNPAGGAAPVSIPGNPGGDMSPVSIQGGTGNGPTSTPPAAPIPPPAPVVVPAAPAVITPPVVITPPPVTPPPAPVPMAPAAPPASDRD